MLLSRAKRLSPAPVFSLRLRLRLRLRLLTGNCGQLQLAEDSDSDIGRTVKLQAIRRLCNRLLMIMLYHRIKKKSNVVFVTKSY